MQPPNLSQLNDLLDDLQRLHGAPVPETHRDTLVQLLGGDATRLRTLAAAEGALPVLDRLNQILAQVVGDTPEALAEARRQLSRGGAQAGPPLEGLQPLLAVGPDALLSELGGWLEALRRGQPADEAAVDVALAKWEDRAPAVFAEQAEDPLRLTGSVKTKIDAAVGDLKLSPLLGSRWPGGR